MSYKELILDCETTGLNAKYNAPWQVAGAVRIDGKIEEEFNFKMNPGDNVNIDMKALAVSNVTLADLKSFPPQALLYGKFMQMLRRYINQYDRKDKFHFVAYNAQFDAEFIREWMTRNGNKWFGSFFWWPPQCVMLTAALKYRTVRADLPNFKLGTVCKYSGIDFSDSDAHDALYDIHKTIELYDLLEKGDNSDV